MIRSPKKYNKLSRIRGAHTRFTRTSKSGVTRIVRDGYASKTKSWWSIQKRILDRDGHQCSNVIDGVRCSNTKHLHVHHIIPLSRGGTSKSSNLITLCESCHSQRHSHMKGLR